jgi:hypothetical protein
MWFRKPPSSLAPQKLPSPLATALSSLPFSPFCHPERTRISYITALTAATHVVLPKENHTQPDRSRNSEQEIRGSRGICGSAGLSWKRNTRACLGICGFLLVLASSKPMASNSQ